MSLYFYFLRRLLILFPILIGISLVVFILLRLVPGEPASMIAGPYADEAGIARVAESLGLHLPIHEQYFIFLRNAITGDLGISWRSGRPVFWELGRRLPASLELTGLSMMLAIFFGVPLGISAAVRKGTWVDSFCRLISVGAVSTPVFWSGAILIFFFFFILGWAPPPLGRIGAGIDPPEYITGLFLIDSLLTLNFEAFFASVRQIILPAITLGFAMSGPIIRMTRSSMLEILGSNFIRTAQSLGINNRKILYNDALKNAILPVITAIGISLGYSLGGVVLMEVIFAWPGLGSYAFNAIINMDHNAVQGFVLLMAVAYVLINLIVDILYAMIDPRITF